MEILNVKAGDEVVYTPSQNNGNRQIKTVEKVTPTGRIKLVGSSKQFNKNGDEIGGDVWSRAWISKATEQEIQEIQEEKFIRECLCKIKKVHELTYAQAIKIATILKRDV